MNIQKLGSIVLMLMLLVGFLAMLPIILDSTTDASAQAITDGDQGTASIIGILPLLAWISGISVALLIVVKAIKN